jgi:hypothetical protein
MLLVFRQSCKGLPKRIFSGFMTPYFEMNLALMIFAQIILPLAKVVAAKSRFSARSRTDGNITANSHQCTDMDQLNHN